VRRMASVAGEKTVWRIEAAAAKRARRVRNARVCACVQTRSARSARYTRRAVKVRSAAVSGVVANAMRGAQGMVVPKNRTA